MPEAAAADYLDPQTLAAIGPIDLRARMIVEGLMQGMHRSPYQGFSVEFAQHRQYAPGDDTRFLDWKVYGRTDKLHVKQFQKETNLDMLVMVDVSGSMAYSSLKRAVVETAGYGRGRGFAGRFRKDTANPDATRRRSVWSKYDHAACLAAAMTYLALRQQDRAALMLFSDAVRASTRLSSARDHWQSIVKVLASAELDERHEPAHDAATSADSATGHTDLTGLMDHVVAKLSKRSLLVLISDLFEDPAALERSFARLYHRRHDMIVLQTLDPAELSFPFRAAAQFVGLEAEGRLRVDPAALRKFYLAQVQEHQQQVERVTRRFRFDYLLVDTSQPLGPPLSHFLAHRAAGISRGRGPAAPVR